ncbi:MAG: class II glutamine amidotransferase [Ekhidna sp.]|nr:class II glutamine amidotransferase [Ekhidna sp.]
MSDPVKHECGVALLRLRKPLQYYIDKYGLSYAAKKMYLLMKKQSNRGQDGVGVANIKIGLSPGYRYISRYRTIDGNPIESIFSKISRKYEKARKDKSGDHGNAAWLRENYAFTGEVWLGHLRYGTHGKNNIENCHPFLRQNNWRSRNLVMAGNFNMTNLDELFDKLVEIGQFPKQKVDTVTVMEKIGHFVDEENQRIFDKYSNQLPNEEITHKIEKEIDLQRVLEKSCRDFDGGYTMAGLLGYGASFVARDPAGIRPAYYYADDEVIVMASEKPAIKTASGCNYDEIKEITPGHALIIGKEGDFEEKQFIDQLPGKSCSFERIYFSRGTDPDIYNERRKLGELLVPQVLKAINFDLRNTVFSYIPNTAEISFLGLMRGIEGYMIEKRKEVILDRKPSADSVEQLLAFQPRVEKLVLKDARLRTFITDDDNRDELVSHVYDTTYEVINKGTDTLVIIDDSIVRGVTLEKSILTLLDRLEPKKIVIVSSAPQIRFPDCYGIDMSKMREFVAFRAMLELLKEKDKEHLLDEVFDKCLAAQADKVPVNHVNELYQQFTDEEIAKKISQIVVPKEMNANVEVVYQSVENLHKACPNHLGDWYFTGNYPTKGGYRVVNRAFINFMKQAEVRAY